ncbi:MAG: hypothetical protein NTV01_22635 [Bacteroidia bacterium]|nr:hypothetical protein [Bacteroidia bacterium]
MRWLIVIVIVMMALPVGAQNDLLDMLDQEIKPVRVLVDATFKSTRVVNCHSIEIR